MRGVTIVILCLAVAGLAVAGGYTIVADSTGTPIVCNDVGVNKCGSCLKGGFKIFSDNVVRKNKYEFYCMECRAGMSVDPSPSILIASSDDKKALLNYNFNIGSKCLTPKPLPVVDKDFTLLHDSTGTPILCNDVGVNKCGNCLKGGFKIFSDSVRRLNKYEFYCMECRAGMSVDSSPSILIASSDDQNALNNHNFNIGSKCLPPKPKRPLPFLTVLHAALFRSV